LLQPKKAYEIYQDWQNSCASSRLGKYCSGGAHEYINRPPDNSKAEISGKCQKARWAFQSSKDFKPRFNIQRDMKGFIYDRNSKIQNAWLYGSDYNNHINVHFDKIKGDNHV